MSDATGLEARDRGWVAPVYFLVYLVWLFLTLEGELAHWATMVLIPITLVAVFQTGSVRSRLGQALRSMGFRPERPTRGLVLTAGLSLAVCLFQVSFSRNGDEMIALLTSARALVAVPMALGFLLVFTAVTEETLFRGYLQTRLERLTGSRVWGLVLSSVLFGIYHVPYAYLNPNWPSAGNWSEAWMSALGQGIPGGLILGGLFLYSGRNLYMPILFHASVDVLPAALMLKVSFGP